MSSLEQTLELCRALLAWFPGMARQWAACRVRKRRWSLEEGSFFAARGTGPRVWDLWREARASMGSSGPWPTRTRSRRRRCVPISGRSCRTWSSGLPGRGVAGLEAGFGGVQVVGRCYSPIEMAAVAWTAIALLGTALAVLLGAYWRLGSRIDAQGQDLGKRIDAQGRHLGERIDAQGSDLGRRIEAQTARIDALNARMDAHLERHAS
jgi:hypothetical protein